MGPQAKGCGVVELMKHMINQMSRYRQCMWKMYESGTCDKSMLEDEQSQWS